MLGLREFIRERVTPLIGRQPDLRRCIETEKNTRLMWATSMMGEKMTLEEAMLANETKVITIWEWTQPIINANVTEVQTPPQDLTSYLNAIAGSSGALGAPPGSSNQQMVPWAGQPPPLPYAGGGATQERNPKRPRYNAFPIHS